MGALSQLEPERKARAARYAEAIANTLAYAADALSQIDGRSANPATSLKARRTAIRELGRVHGYVTTIVEVLQHRLDERRLAGVKKQLESLDQGPLRVLSEDEPVSSELRIDQLYAVEGYFRALTDSLRV